MPKGDWELGKADLKDGYAPVSNTLHLAMARTHNLSGQERQLLNYLIVKTYGLPDGSPRRRRQWAAIGITEWSHAIGTPPNNAARLLRGLVDKNILTKTKSDNPYREPTSYCINTKVKNWQLPDISECLSVIKEYHKAIVERQKRREAQGSVGGRPMQEITDDEDDGVVDLHGIPEPSRTSKGQKRLHPIRTVRG